jgi:hypothetical protein
VWFGVVLSCLCCVVLCLFGFVFVFRTKELGHHSKGRKWVARGQNGRPGQKMAGLCVSVGEGN